MEPIQSSDVQRVTEGNSVCRARRARRFASVIAGISLLSALTACGQGKLNELENPVALREHLSVSATRTYGFESLQDWSAIYSNPTLTLSDAHVEGLKSLSVSGGGWSSFISKKLSNEAPAPTVVGFDLMIPVAQPNPFWFGSVLLVVDIPSRGINSRPLDMKDLKAWTPGQWKRAEFAIPADVRSALGKSYSDLRWRVELNRPTNAIAGYLFDRFTLGALPTCTPTSDNNPCTTDTCDANGQQQHVPVAAGTACSDGNVCNGAETCDVAGTCIAGTPLSTDDSNPCTADACDPTGGITHNPQPAGTNCSNGNACDGAETCNGNGVCTSGAPVVCAALDQCHLPGQCDFANGQCTNPSKPDGEPCNEGNLCTQSDTCQAGTCTGGDPVTCPIPAPCHELGVCQPGTGACTNPVIPGCGLPPDPASVAPPLDRTVVPRFADGIAFLYQGANPIQSGVAPETIERRRATVLRGRVLSRDDTPLPGVLVTVLDHPELGQTRSRSDGAFDLVANGGAPVTLSYVADGHLPVQRTVPTEWNSFVAVPDVVMISPDPAATRVVLPSDAVQVARGTRSIDADGARQATLIFSPETTATITLPGGSTQALHELTVRATEYTVGSTGPRAMPGALPPQSGYTYAVELSVDEALAAGAKRVSFNRPVALYVDNFLGFPVGGVVPIGYYDSDQAAWVGSSNGRVVQVIGEASGLAELDVDGSGIPADPATLHNLGVTESERQELADSYVIGTSLWRASIPHFSPWDANWPFGPPPDATPPEQPEPKKDNPDPDPCKRSGSIIECQNQTLGERLAIPGTAFDLNYRSRRTAGYRASAVLDVPLSGVEVPASLQRIELSIEIAGQVISRTFPPATNQSFLFDWDGTDAYGRRVQGVVPVTTRLGYVYDGTYRTPADIASSFGYSGRGVGIIGNRTSREITLLQVSTARLKSATVGVFDASALRFGGWTLGHHHVYDSAARKLYFGDGQERSGDGLSPVFQAVAGGCCDELSGGSQPATQTSLSVVHGISIGPDGSVYLPHIGLGHFVYAVRPNGIADTLVGQQGFFGSNGDGGPSRNGRVMSPRDTAVGPDGSLYIAETGIRRITPDETIRTVAPIGATAIAVASDGTLYAAVGGRILRVQPDGSAVHIAGNPDVLALGDGGPALEAWFLAQDLAIGPDGSLYLSDRQNARIRRIDLDGIITTVAGGGTPIDGVGDGGPATQAQLGIETSIAVAPNGGLFVTDGGRIRYVNTRGIITTIAGGGSARPFVDFTAGSIAGRFATSVSIAPDRFGSVAVGPDGRVYVVYRLNQSSRVLNLNELLPDFEAGASFVPSSDGAEFYRFDSDGRHSETRDAATGAVLARFIYDADGLLVAMTDRDGAMTEVVRASNGDLQRIVSPDGVTTGIELDGNGYLAALTYADGTSSAFTYSPSGLLTSHTDRRGATSRMNYDAFGRLTKDADPAGGSWTLTRDDQPSAYTTSLTSALNRTTTYLTEQSMSGERQRVTTDPNGVAFVSSQATDGSLILSQPDGTVVTVTHKPDGLLQMMAPQMSSVVRLPSGLTRATARSRSVSLANPNDVFSVSQIEEQRIENGRLWTERTVVSTRQTVATTPVGRQSVTARDAQHRVTSNQVGGLAAETYAYDTRGRITTVIQESGGEARTTMLTYDDLGRLDSVVDPTNRARRFAYDQAGRVTGHTLEDGRVLSLAHDANGNVTSVTPPGREPHEFAYTPVNLEGQYTPPAVPDVGEPATRYDYNLDRQPTSMSIPGGLVIGFEYDDGGRLSRILSPDDSVLFGYSPSTGQLTTSVTSRGVGLSYKYDGPLVVSESWSGPVAGVVSRTYNDFFDVGSLTVGDLAVPLTYDDDRLLVQAGELAIKRSRLNDLVVATSLGSIATTREYNAFGELERAQAVQAGGQLLDVQYKRDKLGRITELTETAAGRPPNRRTYKYDPAGRLTETTTNDIAHASYGYDENGNRITETTAAGTIAASYDAQDRLLTYGGVSYAYGANGELQAKTNVVGSTRYWYDAFGNLTRVVLPGGDVVEYLIDGSDRRVGKRVNGLLVQGFLYQDQLRPVAEFDGSGAVSRRFVYGTHDNVPDYMIQGGRTYRILSDHLGSPRLIVDATSGEVKQRLDYDEFGIVVSDSSPGFQPFGFAGGIYDPQTALVRFGARDYDAEVGRWTAKDPIRFKGNDSNLYGYAFNDPINAKDVDGQETVGKTKLPLAPVFTAACSGAEGLADAVENEVNRGRQETYENNKRAIYDTYRTGADGCMLHTDLCKYQECLRNLNRRVDNRERENVDFLLTPSYKLPEVPRAILRVICAFF